MWSVIPACVAFQDSHVNHHSTVNQLEAFATRHVPLGRIRTQVCAKMAAIAVSNMLATTQRPAWISMAIAPRTLTPVMVYYSQRCVLERTALAAGQVSSSSTLC
ncbi:uncharacterized protein [Macrobrachium rosenbergii]|uniref:uncharacterized protein n=1 Tax=Macrobrachium rosenbergii TaxID=79674 RepID=UPI0034D510C5